MLLVDTTHYVAYQSSSSLPETSVMTRRQRVSTDTIVEKRIVVGNKARVTRVQGAEDLATLVDAGVCQSKVAHRVPSADIDKSGSGPAELGDTTRKPTEGHGVGGVEKLQVVSSDMQSQIRLHLEVSGSGQKPVIPVADFATGADAAA